MLGFGQNGILEERSGTQAVRISGHNQHAFQGSDVAHSLACLRQIGRSFAAREVALQVGVSQARLALWGGA